MTKIRKAATIMLGRDNQGELEVLLLRRNKALVFAGGLWVFPGGKIEVEDYQEDEGELTAAKVAAVRETKEEANLDIEMEQLSFYRHWTTPEGEVRRFATYFFYAATSNSLNKVQIDDSEIKDHRWINPRRAIELFKQSKLAMLPPTLMSLQLISKCKTAIEAQALLQKEIPIYVLPVLVAQENKMICMYEGDAGYITAKANTEGARHRLVVDFSGGDFTFEYKDCDNIPPVNGGMGI